MAHVKKKKQSADLWKPVKINPGYFANHDGTDIVSLEVLSDYNLSKDGTLSFASGKKKKKEKKKKDKAKKAKGSAEVEGEVDSHRGTDPPNKESGNKAKKATKNRKPKSSDLTKEPEKTEKIQDNESDKYEEDGEDQLEFESDDSDSVPEEVSETPVTGEQKKRKLVKDSNESESSQKKLKVLNPDTDMTAWKNLFVPPVVLKALAEDGFDSPTPIQVLALPHAIRDKMDIVGAAPTGSGKTLAFAIPVINRILNPGKPEKRSTEEAGDKVSDEEPEGDEPEEDSNEEEEEGSDNDSEGFDLPPDSEDEDVSDLSDQEMGCVAVKNNVTFPWLNEAASDGKNDAATPKKSLQALVLCPTRELAIQVKDHIQRAIRYTDLMVMNIVGGMATQKQERLLKKFPDIVVATPGRLWELIKEGESHLTTICDIKSLVIDEADRMVEQGHFQELTNILQLVNGDEKKRARRQTFVFSATLTMIHSGPDRVMKKRKKNQIKTAEAKLGALMQHIGMRDKPKVIDLTGQVGTAETLTEARISCTMEEKDIYLHYFLQQYPGRTLVFANSKDCIRRLVSIFTLLQCNPLPLHADMHQRQRLKNLDKFKSSPRGLLLATDVAARGLDIPDVQHVIHYQVPRTTENYVHRSGRTARALKEGLSVVLIGPQDIKNYRKIISVLNKDEDLPLFPTEVDIVSKAKAAVQLARQIDKEEHGVAKLKTKNDWFIKAAKEMDMELDENEFLEDAGDEFTQCQQRQKIQKLRYELSSMLSHPMRNRSTVGKYPTKSGKLIIPQSREDASAIQNVQKDHKSNKPLIDAVKAEKVKQRPRKKKFKQKRK